MDDTLLELQQKIAEKSALEAKRSELVEQKREYDRQVISLRVALRREQEDVEKLENKSLASFFLQVRGKLEDTLDRQRAEAFAAKAKLDAAERELLGIDRDMADIQRRLAEIRVAQARYQELVEKKRMAIKTAGTAAAEQILRLEENMASVKVQKQEIREAISAGTGARRIVDRILSELDSAEGWNTWDMLGGGGILTHVAKHGHLDDAQELVYQLQSSLRRFRTELADIQITADLKVNIDGFARFADFFFDGLLADWAVGDRISQSRSAVSGTGSQITRLLDRLGKMEENADHRLEQLRIQLEELVVRSETEV